MSKIRVFYCGCVNSSEYAKHVSEPLFVAAASNKMHSIVKALRINKVNAWIFSSPVFPSDSKKWLYPKKIQKKNSQPVVYMASSSNKYIRLFIAMVTFSWMCFRNVRSSDIVIFYNHSFEFLFGLIILRLRGVLPFLDIEDVPRDDAKGYYEKILNHIFFLFYKLTDSRKIVVSNQIASNLGIKDYFVAYGAVEGSCKLPYRSNKIKWDSLEKNSPLRIHYGGTICEDTGLFLVCDVIRYMLGVLNDYNMQIVITGIGGEKEFTELQSECKYSNIEIIVKRDLSREDYIDTLDSCHASLAMKLKGRSMSDTTFPSKVVEITSHGVLLISTVVSDIQLLFDDSNSLLLHVATPECIGDKILSIFKHKDNMYNISINGYKVANKTFNERIVGKKLAKFLDAC